MANARKYAGNSFIGLKDLKGQPPLLERIEFVTEEDGKFGERLVVTLESGKRLSLNATSVGNLIRAFGADFDDWTGHEVKIYAGQVKFGAGTADAILVEAIVDTPPPAPTKAPKKTSTPAAAKAGGDMDDEVPF